MMPTKRFVHDSVTKAELGMEKAKDDGYISGIDENLREKRAKFKFGRKEGPPAASHKR